jgi:hypothetical protein
MQPHAHIARFDKPDIFRGPVKFNQPAGCQPFNSFTQFRLGAAIIDDYDPVGPRTLRMRSPPASRDRRSGKSKQSGRWASAGFRSTRHSEPRLLEPLAILRAAVPRVGQGTSPGASPHGSEVALASPPRPLAAGLGASPHFGGRRTVCPNILTSSPESVKWTLNDMGMA